MDKYVKGPVVGEGTYGCVYKAVNTRTGRMVALKKFRLARGTEAAKCCAEREVDALQQLRHEHIVEFIEVIPHKGNLVLVFEYMDSDLEAVINDPVVDLGPADIKAYMRGLLLALQAIHEAGYIHRDVKPNNLLLSLAGGVKLADFGSSCSASARDDDGRMTSQVFARFYRPPEILLGAPLYGPSVDLWAAGCVFAELLLRRVWLEGASEIDQLSKIFEVLGSPSEVTWPGVSSLPAYFPFPSRTAKPLSEQMPGVPEEALELLTGLVALDPARRLTATQALQHRYFSTGPDPTPPSRLPCHSRNHVQQHHPHLQELQNLLNIPSRPCPPADAIPALAAPAACAPPASKPPLKRQSSLPPASLPPGPCHVPPCYSASCTDMSISTVSTKRSRGAADLDVATAARCLPLRSSHESWESGHPWAAVTPPSALLPMSVDAEGGGSGGGGSGASSGEGGGSEGGSDLPDSSVGGLFRLQPSSGDLRYLRARKLHMDSALLSASCATSPCNTAAAGT